MVVLSSLIYEFHGRGLTNRAIAKKLKCHHNTVGYWLKKVGKRSNFANQPIDMVNENEARCGRCKQIKLLNQFLYGRRGQKYEYRFSYCKECRRKQWYSRINKDVKRFLSDRYCRLLRKAKEKNIPFAITKNDFIQTYFLQKGRCFYTDEILTWKAGNGKHFNSEISIDKIVPEKGYVKGNVVFCTTRVNTAKSNFNLEEVKKWMPRWYEKICEKNATLSNG